MSEFYRDSAERRLQQLTANRAANVADLEVHRLNGDHDAAGECIQQLANIDSERANLVQLYQNYEQSQRPAQKPYETQEQKAAKPWSQMGWDDIVEMTRTSKYAKDIRPDDQNMVAGWHEARARRGRGE
jgi:hypothetical protein